MGSPCPQCGHSFALSDIGSQQLGHCCMITSRKVGAKLRFGGSVIWCRARDNRNRNFHRLNKHSALSNVGNSEIEASEREAIPAISPGRLRRCPSFPASDRKRFVCRRVISKVPVRRVSKFESWRFDFVERSSNMKFSRATMEPGRTAEN